MAHREVISNCGLRSDYSLGFARISSASETMSQPVIPDEDAEGERGPESSKSSYDQVISGSRLASAAGGLGRDDELRQYPST
jgi:hypothetical protein